MARKQTRRSISLSGSTYDQVKRYCATHDIAMSHFVEVLVAEFFGEDPPKREKKTKLKKKEDTRDRVPGSDKPKEPPAYADKKPIRGGGTHVF